MLLGLALRMATDINLHRKIPYAPDDSEDARSTNWEIRNRERTWLWVSITRWKRAYLSQPCSLDFAFLWTEVMPPRWVNLTPFWKSMSEDFSRYLELIPSPVALPSEMQRSGGNTPKRCPSTRASRHMRSV